MPDKDPVKNIETKGYYPFLDGLRGIAILWVLLHHTNSFFALKDSFNIWLARLLWLGSLGVDIFFVTSGFLITGLLIGGLEGEIRLERFYLRRAFKIIPQYLLTVIIGLVFVALDKQHYKPVQIASYFLMFQNYVNPIPVLEHLWSIAIEEHFYLIYPLILFMVCRLCRDVKGRRAVVVIILLVLIVLGNFVRYRWFLAKGPNAIIDSTVWQVTHVRFDALLFGCVLKFLEPYFCRAGRSRGRFLSAVYFAGGALVYLFLAFQYRPIEWAHHTLAYIGPGCLLVSALTGFYPIRAATENPVLRWVGRSSYGIYLWHYVLLYPFLLLTFRFSGHKLIAVAYVFCAVAVGALMTKTVERYFLKIRDRLVP